MKIVEKNALLETSEAQPDGQARPQYPVHLQLPILPPEQQLVIDPRDKLKTKFGIVSLLIDHPTKRAQVMHEVFSPVALRLFIPLITSYQFCPYHYLLAAYQAKWPTIEKLLFTPTVEAAKSFYDLAQIYKLRLEEAQAISGDVWEWELRPVRRAMTEIIRHTGIFGLNVFTLRSSGYRVERVLHELHVRKGGPKREHQLQYG